MAKKPSPPPTILGSASRLKRSLACPTSCVLPQEPQEPSEKAQAAIDKGNAVHEYLENAPEAPAQALSEVPEKHQKYCGKIALPQAAGYWTPPHFREAAFVWDGFTLQAREHLTDGPRGYGALDTLEVPGTADVVIPGFWTCEVWDYKTGKWPVAAEGNTQLLFLALCASKTVAPNADQFVLGIQTLKGYGRIDCGTPWIVNREILSDFENDLCEAQARALSEWENYHSDPLNINPRPDDDVCRFCPCRKACPAIEGE